MKRGPITRRTPLRPRRLTAREKREKFEREFYSEERREWIEALPCVVPGCYNGPCHNAHVKSRGAGGTYRDVVSLCANHHHEQHSVGTKTFESRHGIDLTELARQTQQRWEDGS